MYLRNVCFGMCEADAVLASITDHFLVAQVCFLAEGFLSVPLPSALKGGRVVCRLVKSLSTKVHLITQDLGVGCGLLGFFPSVLESLFFFKVIFGVWGIFVCFGVFFSLEHIL